MTAMSEQINSPSPFYDDLTDERERERFRLLGREIYTLYGKNSDEAYKGHVEYGKWLIASLLAVHGGSIFAISGLKGSVKPAQLPALIDGAAFNLAGVFLTLLAGFCAWLNFQFAHSLYRDWQRPEMLFRRDCFPSDLKPDSRKSVWRVNAAMYAAAGVGFAAGLCFVASSCFVVISLRSTPIDEIKPVHTTLLSPEPLQLFSAFRASPQN